jgi:hypothetical protein
MRPFFEATKIAKNFINTNHSAITGVRQISIMRHD